MQRRGTYVDHLDILARVLLPVLALQDRPPVLVKLDGGDDNVAGVDANG